MWIKNVNAYAFKGLTLNVDELSKCFEQRKFQSCLPTQAKSAGWISVFGDMNEVLVHSLMDCHFFSLKLQEKIISSSVVRELADERIEEMKARDPDFVVKAAVKKQIREQIYLELLPTAQSKITRTLAYFDVKQGLLIIDTPSRTKAENFLMMLRSTISGDVSYIPLQSVHEPSKQMSNWLITEKQPKDFDFGQKCSLIDTESLGTIRYAKHEMHDSKIKEYLENKKTVSELELEWNESLIFTLTDDLLIKGIKYLDQVKDAATEEAYDNESESKDVILRIVAGTMRNFIPYLLDTLGGQHFPKEESTTLL